LELRCLFSAGAIARSWAPSTSPWAELQRVLPAQVRCVYSQCSVAALQAGKYCIVNVYILSAMLQRYRQVVAALQAVLYSQCSVVSQCYILSAVLYCSVTSSVQCCIAVLYPQCSVVLQCYILSAVLQHYRQVGWVRP